MASLLMASVLLSGPDNSLGCVRPRKKVNGKSYPSGRGLACSEQGEDSKQTSAESVHHGDNEHVMNRLC